ncbi:tape measure domain-containing protein [Lysinibacillus sp. FJAT-14745]|uniref:tape measure protein n=1 Tax=Lysinibacillus sp. FJAT-14745 TaxID=1704289 RepID=UPI0006ABEAE2|nr:tape measure domain-containing protein [Lysinibacillus sp. FJAT-14745]
MATIRTAIQIQDQLSQPMRAMHNAVSMMVNQMEAMHAASGQMIDTSSVGLARRELAMAADAMNRIESEVTDAATTQQRFTNNIRDGTSAADGLLNKIIGIAAAYLSFQTGKNIIGLSDEMINTQARLELMNSTYHKNAESANGVNSMLMKTSELQQMIFESAQRTATSYQSTADMVGKLGMQASGAFANTTEIVAFAEQINKTFAIAGTSAEGVSSVMLQLTQAMAAGKLQGEELNAVLDNAQPIVANIQRYLEEAMNIDASNIKKLASDGVITADIIKNAMFYAAEETNAAFGSIPTKWSDIWTIMTDRALMAFTPVLQKINDLANSDRTKQIMESTTVALKQMADVAIFAMDILAAGGSFIYDHWSIIGPIVGTVTAALIAYGIALTTIKLITMATAIWQGILAIRTAGQAAATMMATGATFAQTAAQYGLNAALYACPLTWIILLIIALVGVFYLAIGVVNHFAGTSISATGAIAGAFMMLATHIYNIIAYLWNIFASIVEFWVNIWFNGNYTVKRLFANLANNALDMAISMIGSFDSAATNLANMFISGANMAIQAINWVIDALNKVPGIDIGKMSEFNARTSVTADLSKLKKGVNDWVGETPADYWEAPKMEMKSLGAAWDTGYNWGADLFSSDKNKDKSNSGKAIEDAMKNAMNGAGKGAGIGDKLDKGNRNGGKTAGNTAKMAKSMEGSGEDLKYLRDIAEREAINRYTTAEINIDMKNENHINNEMDIDGVIDRFGERAEEVADMLAEGGPTEDV